MKSEEPFLMAVLWDTWHSGQDDALSTFTILTTEPNEMMRELHHRMPVIIASADAQRWLDRGEREIGDLLRPYPSEKMMAYPVRTLVNSVRNDGPELIEAA